MISSRGSGASDAYHSLLEIGTALSGLVDLDALLEMILMSAKRLSNADGGTLYLADNDGALHYKILHTSSLNLSLGGASGGSPNLPPISINDMGALAGYCAREKVSLSVPDIYLDTRFDFSGSRTFDIANGYRTLSILGVPLIDPRGDAIGVLQLINAIDPNSGKPIPFNAEAQELCEALASQAAVAISNRALMTQLEELFLALIKLINDAIDDKSPYTGGHCNRVPELTLMLAEATCAADYGPLRDFDMTRDDFYELRVAGLLHDCGKIVTPVHVVDKATKLETIFDRIALIDTRFEVMILKHEIALLKGEIDQAEHDRRYASCIANRDFLRQANIGGERMQPEDIDRVHAIASERWQPAGEESQPFLNENEVENLIIVAGTLTSAERDIINHHIIATIRMLEALPWPRHLKNVTEYAGGHHERMDGRGYPKGLKREEMSVQARMMAIADVFEALTAADRPYKKGKTLSEALRIMSFLRNDLHIDPDLFDVFLREKVYERYAKEFLPPEQIDAVDAEKLMSVHA
jgi:HD-GYP domain-containing protein (c-di-GMP phosphodiesterase class II)